MDDIFCAITEEKGLLEKIAWKDIYMNFMLAINEDFDDDLLQDAMGLLVDL
jgi:hypothetical protein